MHLNQKGRKTRLICCLFLLVMLGAVQARAGSLSVLTELKLNGEVNDNVRYSATQKTTDYIGIANPSVSFAYESERLELTSLIDVNFERYMNEEDLDDEKEYYRLGGNYRITERSVLSGRFSLTRDNTQDSEFQETGVLVQRLDSNHYQAQIGLKRSLGENLSGEVLYKYAETDYSGGTEERSNHELHSVSLPFSRVFNDRLDTLTLEPLFTKGESDSSEVDNYGVTLGWRHRISETIQFNSVAGARYTESDLKKRNSTEKNWGGTVDVGFVNRGPNFQYSLGYRRNIRYSPSGNLLETDKIYGRVAYKITERLDFKLLGNFVVSNSETDFEDDGGTLLDISPSLSYALTENYFLLLGYKFTWYLDDSAVEDDETEINRLWIGIAFQFPKSW